jgi:CRP-like cAMP-binding protein
VRVRFRPSFEILRALDLFTPVSDGELMKFAALGRERRVERGRSVLAATGFYEPPLALILEGEALLAWGRGPDDLFLRALEAGDLVGETELFTALHPTQEVAVWPYSVREGGVQPNLSGLQLGDEERVATARALTTVRLIEWDRDAVCEALRRWPDVSLSLLAGMARRQRDLHRRIAGLCRQRAPQRLARAVNALLEERGVSLRDDAGRGRLLLPRTPPCTRLAEMAGMARETVSRLLTEWTRRGWTSRRDGDLLILDHGQWRTLVGGEAV